MIPVQNVSSVMQGIGRWEIYPGATVRLPYEIAKVLATQREFRVEDPALLGDFSLKDDDGTYLGWSSPFYYADGYGSVAQEIAAAFIEKLGVRLSIFPRDYDPSMKRFGGIPLEEWASDAFVPESIVKRLLEPQDKCFYGINMTWPKDADDHHFPRGISHTMFESTRPPAEWVGPMNRCRRIIVPCRQNKQAFESIGVTVPIDVVNQGVNPDRWPVVDRTNWDNKKEFTFLMAAGLTPRKNPVGAANAFVKAFPNGENVRLVLKTRGDCTALAFRIWIDELPKDPRIQVVSEESTPDEMYRWFAESDAFVFPSHGEGFGLTALEAMTCGMPTIVSDNSGMSEYCDDRYNIPIPCREIPVPKQSDGGYPDAWGDCGNWWEPDEVALVRAYQTVWKNRKVWARVGLKAAEWVRSEFRIDQTAKRMLDVVMADASDCGVTAW